MRETTVQIPKQSACQKRTIKDASDTVKYLRNMNLKNGTCVFLLQMG